MAAQLKTTPASRRLGLFAGAAALVVAFDQLVKVWARASLTPGSPVTLIPHVMDLSLVYNTGAAFSMGEGKGALFVLIIGIIGFCIAVYSIGLVRQLVADGVYGPDQVKQYYAFYSLFLFFTRNIF